jgi:hypothetical protein
MVRVKPTFWVIAGGAIAAVIGVYVLLIVGAARRPDAAVPKRGAEAGAVTEDGPFRYADARPRPAMPPRRFAIDALPTSDDELRESLGSSNDHTPWAYIHTRLCAGDETWFARVHEHAVRSIERDGTSAQAEWGDLLRRCFPARHCDALARRLDAAGGAMREAYWAAFGEQCLDDRWRARIESDASATVVVDWTLTRMEAGYGLAWTDRYVDAVIDEFSSGSTLDLRAAAGLIAASGDPRAEQALLRVHEHMAGDWRRPTVAGAIARLARRDGRVGSKARTIARRHCRDYPGDDACAVGDAPRTPAAAVSAAAGLEPRLRTLGLIDAAPPGVGRPPLRGSTVEDVLRHHERLAELERSLESERPFDDLTAYRLAWLARPHLDDVRFELVLPRADEDPERRHVLHAYVDGKRYRAPGASPLELVNRLLADRGVAMRCLELRRDARATFVCGPRDALLRLIAEDLLELEDDDGQRGDDDGEGDR